MKNQTNRLLKLHEKNIKLKEELSRLNTHSQNLNLQLSIITSAKAFKLWQSINKLKKIKLTKIATVLLRAVTSKNYLLTKIDSNNQQDISSQQINLDYPNWFSQHSPNDKRLKQQQTISQSFAYRPKISIITPTYNTPPKFLKECVQSVINQTYDNWELCLADDNSTSKSTKDLIKKLAATDKRIKYIFRKTNGHICHASNTALKISTGEYIILLDHDDLLLPNSLFECVKLLNKKPTLDFIYSDEDKLSEDGITPTEPYFKPNWSPDKLFGFMYVGHLSLYRKSIIKKSGLFSIGTHGAQDYDLLLKSSKYFRQIAHLPKILYRWRRHPESTSANLASKPYAIEAGKRVLQKRLKAYINGDFKVNNPNIGFYKLTDFDIPPKSVDIFLNSKNIKTIPNIIKKKLNDKLLSINFFSSITDLNRHLQNSKAIYFLIINQKIENDIKDDILDFIGYLNVKDVGIIGPKIVNSENKIVSAGYALIDKKIVSPHHYQFDSYGYGNDLAIQSNTLGVDNCFFALTKNTFLSNIKNFNYSHPNTYLLESSIKLLRRHIRTVILPQFTITIDNYQAPFALQKTTIFKQLIKNKLNNKDPYFNHNLTIDKKGSILLNR